MYDFQAGGTHLNIYALPLLGEGIRAGFAIEL